MFCKISVDDTTVAINANFINCLAADAVALYVNIPFMTSLEDGLIMAD